jgi:hypothetical protein
MDVIITVLLLICYENEKHIFTDGNRMLSKASAYCVRVCDRVLTDEEILSNYEFDKRIFK